MIPLRAQTVYARLQELGVVTQQQVEQVKQELLNTQESASIVLVRLGILRDTQMGKRLISQLGLFPQRLQPPEPHAVEVLSRELPVPQALLRAHRFVPVRRDAEGLFLATDDPLSVLTLEALAKQCGCSVEAVLVSESDLNSWLALLGGGTAQDARSLTPAPKTSDSSPPIPRPAFPEAVLPQVKGAKVALLQSVPQSREAVSVSPTPKASPILTSSPQPSVKLVTQPAKIPAVQPTAPLASPQLTAKADDQPIIRLVDSMLSEAVRMRASDVHVQLDSNDLLVRYRIDGVLRHVNKPPKALHGPITSRIKILGGLNIAEKRLPQDGRLQLTVEGKPLDVRVSTLPAMHGESIVMRLLDRSQPMRSLSDLGLHLDDQERWNELISRPHGMILVTGPTGSGKTTTLYGALAKLNRPDRKLITVEDPVEYQLPGVNQVAVKSLIGLTFAAGLRAMLRQAPDIIMVGEIRDRETAQVAIQAALTGHLVLSTLHTNDASSAMTRLIDMGIAPFLVASTVQGVLAQRLVRKICSHCQVAQPVTPEERVFLGKPEIEQLMHAQGCEECHGSGFLGRLGLFELLSVTDAIRRLVVSKAFASAIRAAADKEGFCGLREDGKRKIHAGLTTVTEVLRVVAGSGE